MIIYLISMTIFMIQCFTMFFIYLGGQKEYRNNLKNAYNSQVPTDEFFYFIMIPCLNEGKVIQDTIQHLMDLPGQKQIIVIDDDSIDDTLIQAHKINGPITIHERKLPKARTGKGDSLNSALPVVINFIRKHHLNPQKCIVGVLDADGVLSANSTYKLNDAFNDPTVDAVQLRVKMKSPNKILQTFQDIEFYVINNLIQLIRVNLNAVALCGNGQFFRVSSVLKQLGYQPWGNALLEDYELTLRMELHGLKIRYLNDAYVDQEALISVKRLIKQRARWAQGGWNCWKYLPDVTKSKIMAPSQKFDAYFFFFQPIINILGDFSIIYLTVQFILRYAHEPGFLIIALILLAFAGLFFGTIFTMIYRKEIKTTDAAKLELARLDMMNDHLHFRKTFLSIGLISYIYIILFVSIIISLYHLIVGHRTWDKTKRI